MRNDTPSRSSSASRPTSPNASTSSPKSGASPAPEPSGCSSKSTTRPIDELRALIASGELHHATYRNKGTVWEGIWFYPRDPKGFRGYGIPGCVSVNDQDIEEAFRLLAGKGMHVGCYGGG